MTLNRSIIIAAALTMTVGAAATDYTPLRGKCGAALKQAVKDLALQHKEISYGEKTWEAFLQTDVRMINGRQAWFDMYSNRLVYTDEGHSGMNIEHSVANGWWDGVKNAAYKDLYHLNPSDADANNRKNDNPLGEIEGTPTWSNGLTRIGAPSPATGGGSKVVFEPADEYKGDFARAYFYIFTIYDDITWKTSPAYMYEATSWPTLKPWATEMLLRWAAEDPVDAREIGRARAVAGIQDNVNPFVELPDLAEYVWGDKKATPYQLTDPVYAPDRPEAPTFGDYNLAGVNTWTGRWWDATAVTLSSDAPEMYYTLTDSDEYQLYDAPIVIGHAARPGETVTIKAFARSWYEGRDYDSSVATLTLTAREAGATDYMHAVWQKVADVSEIGEEELYIIVGSKAPYAVMSRNALASSSSKYIGVAGNVTVSEGQITLVPETTAVVRLLPAGGNQYYLSVSDLGLNEAGCLSATTARQMVIAEQGAPATVGIGRDGSAEINFGASIGTLQYNSSSPRFLPYTSSQQKVDLYRCVAATTGVDNAGLSIDEEADLSVWYDLQGRPVDIERAEPGIYIEITGKKARKIKK